MANSQDVSAYDASCLRYSFSSDGETAKQSFTLVWNQLRSRQTEPNMRELVTGFWEIAIYYGVQKHYNMSFEDFTIKYECPLYVRHSQDMQSLETILKCWPDDYYSTLHLDARAALPSTATRNLLKALAAIARVEEFETFRYKVGCFARIGLRAELMAGTITITPELLWNYHDARLVQSYQETGGLHQLRLNGDGLIDTGLYRGQMDFYFRSHLQDGANCSCHGGRRVKDSNYWAPFLIAIQGPPKRKATRDSEVSSPATKVLRHIQPSPSSSTNNSIQQNETAMNRQDQSSTCHPSECPIAEPLQGSPKQHSSDTDAKDTDTEGTDATCEDVEQTEGHMSFTRSPLNVLEEMAVFSSTKYELVLKSLQASCGDIMHARELQGTAASNKKLATTRYDVEIRAPLAKLELLKRSRRNYEELQAQLAAYRDQYPDPDLISVAWDEERYNAQLKVHEEKRRKAEQRQEQLLAEAQTSEEYARSKEASEVEMFKRFQGLIARIGHEVSYEDFFQAWGKLGDPNWKPSP